uniref:Uncharacterized protein n=1 Tax=Bracon brevicornis TaxID=1563983 RepID=A0A6V7J8V8_9HYME
MGGQGTERTARHKLNGVPNNVGHGDNFLVIGDKQPGACRCCNNPINHHQHSTILLPSPIQGYLNNLRNSITGSLLSLDTINNNNHQYNKAKVDTNDSANKTTMSSPPKHRRGFDPNDNTGGDYRRYHRVKTRK